MPRAGVPYCTRDQGDHLTIWAPYQLVRPRRWLIVQLCPVAEEVMRNVPFPRIPGASLYGRITPYRSRFHRLVGFSSSG